MTRDPLVELRFALAEADAGEIAAPARSRILAAALAGRPPGYSAGWHESISGPETLRRVAARLESLLAALAPSDWASASIRGLDVQQLVGHLIGVEAAFAAALGGDRTPAEADHVDSTAATAAAQSGRDPASTAAEWSASVRTTLALAGDGRDLQAPVRMHGITFPADSFLVVRAFEVWTHEEDIRRATGRDPADPDPAVLARMTDLASSLLPLGVALRGGHSGPPARVRLVLSGPGGGSWDVQLAPGGGTSARAAPGSEPDAHVTVDAAQFCRVVADRSSLPGSAAVVSGARAPVEALFDAAAALALD